MGFGLGSENIDKGEQYKPKRSQAKTKDHTQKLTATMKRNEREKPKSPKIFLMFIIHSAFRTVKL
jgi:hypothetical protein